MSTKFLATGALVAGLVIFIWGAIAHTVPMLPGSLFDFKDKEGVLDAVRAQTAGNGVDFDTRGVFAVVALRPDLGEQGSADGPEPRGRVRDERNRGAGAGLAAAIRAAGVMASDSFCALAGVAAFLGTQVSYWN
jgi:hypothetical protein